MIPMLEKFNFSMAALLLVIKVQEPYVSPLKCKIRLGKKNVVANEGSTSKHISD